MQRGSNISAINESSLYKNLNITLGDQLIESDKITDMEINWSNNFRVTGYIKVNDIYDIANSTVIDSSKTVVVYLSDLHDEFYSREFKIVNILETKSQNDKMLKLEIQDIVSWELENTYISKGFAGKKLSDIFKHYLSLKADSLISGFPIEKNISDTTISRENIVVPLHMNFLDFIESELNKEGFVIYQDKKSINLVSAKDIVHSKLDKVEHVYKQVDSNILYGFKIIGYSMNYNSLKVTNKLPIKQTLVYNPKTKSMDKYEQNLSTIYRDIKVTGEEDASQLTNGEFRETQEYGTSDNLFLETLRTYEKSSKLEVAVPGNVKFNKTYYIMDVLLSGNQFATNSQASGDLRLSGEYVCTGIIDKIVPGEKFIQKLKLNRVDYGKVE